eukprot:4352843-Amphidinium_carterae.1
MQHPSLGTYVSVFVLDARPNKAWLREESLPKDIVLMFLPFYFTLHVTMNLHYSMFTCGCAAQPPCVWLRATARCSPGAASSPRQLGFVLALMRVLMTQDSRLKTQVHLSAVGCSDSL